MGTNTHLTTIISGEGRKRKNMEDDDEGENKMQSQMNEDYENTASKFAIPKDSISTKSGRSKRNNDT